MFFSSSGLFRNPPGGDDVALAALAPTGNGDDMVHRDFLRLEFSAAIMANPLLNLLRPPRRLP